jgi:serine O-acetyltransferase
MSYARLQAFKGWLRRFWVFSPERLWLASIALRKRGHWMLAFWLKQVNTFLYHNSLAPAASVSPDIQLGHNSIGIVVTGSCEIGRRVKIWHNVTLSAGRRMRVDAPTGPAGEPGAAGGPSFSGPLSRIVIEDGVKIGANAVVIAPRGRTLRIGRGARIGAGTVVTKDVPERGTVVGPPARLVEEEWENT